MKLLPDYIRTPKEYRYVGDFFGKVEEKEDQFDYKARVYYTNYDVNFDSNSKIPKNKFLFNKKHFLTITLRAEAYDFLSKKQVIEMIFEDPIGVQ